MTDCPDDLRELYCEFGRAGELAQLMEMEAGNLALVYATMLVDTSRITDEQREFFRALVQDVNKRTFGNLFLQIQNLGQIGSSILDTVNDALEKRNYLTHKFFREHNFAIGSVEGRKTMLAELLEIQASLSLANAVLLGMTESLAKVLGHKVLSEQEVLTLMAEAKRVDI